MSVDKWNGKLLCAKTVADMKECLNNGANVNCPGSPLHAAIRLGCKSLIEFLVTRGADINNANSGYDPPLIHAINSLCYYDSIVKYLVDKEANVCKVDEKGRTALSLAIQKKNKEIVNYLLNYGVGAKYCVQAAFLDAIETQDVEMVQLLKNKGADVNTIYRNGYTPLSKAVETSSVSVVEYLMEAGADPNKPDGKGVPLLVKAVEMGRLEMVQLLMETCGHQTSSLFQKALHKERFEIVQFFVKRGENVDQVFENKECPLGIAASNLDLKTFQFLVDSGANIELAMGKIQEVMESNEIFEFYFRSLQEEKNMKGGIGPEED